MPKATQASADEATAAPLRISRVLHARRETVFKAWSSAEHLKRWFAPATFTIPEANVDMRAGGAFELSMRSPTGETHWIRGAFVEVKPHDRLTIDMIVEDSAHKPLFRAFTEVDFADALGGARLDITQTYTLIDPTKAWMTAGAPEGWRSTLDNLEKEVVRMQGGVDVAARSVVHATFRIERAYDASATRLWKALTDAAAKQKWFSGSAGRWEQIERHMDVRVGGSERLKGRWEGGVVSTFDAVYHDVVPNERLVYSYIMHLDEKKISVSLATIELKADGTKTRLVVTEQGAFLDGYDDADSREHGTGLLLDALGESLKD